MNAIPINLAVEDEVSEAVALRLLQESGRDFAVGTCYRRGGFGYVKRTIRGFNNAAKGTPFLVLTDLDAVNCAPALIHDWLPVPIHPNLIFRVAVREVEAWIIADRESLAKLLGVSVTLVPTDVEGITDPKQYLINIAAKSPYGVLRQDIVPRANSTAKQGPNYNGQLVGFVRSRWRAQVAARRSRSLRGALERLKGFRPRWSSDDTR